MMDYRYRHSHAWNISNQHLYYCQHYNEVLPRVSLTYRRGQLPNQYTTYHIFLFHKQSRTRDILQLRNTEQDNLQQLHRNWVTTLRKPGHQPNQTRATAGKTSKITDSPPMPTTSQDHSQRTHRNPQYYTRRRNLKLTSSRRCTRYKKNPTGDSEIDFNNT
jgi:hypothetical protein